jgi:hypothetical protein
VSEKIQSEVSEMEHRLVHGKKLQDRNGNLMDGVVTESWALKNDWYRHECGHLEMKTESPNGLGLYLNTPGQCLACREKRIGTTIDFIRYGKPSSVSFNYRDGSYENGVSVYELRDGKPIYSGWYFGFLSRPKYIGKGKIVGWGSDGEPLVRIISMRPDTSKSRER